VTHLENGKTLPLGPFKITPYLMDHSAYDSYAVLIEGDGKRIFYTGDLRGHGRKGSLFTRLVATPPLGVDVLLMEGTNGRKNSEKGFPTENDLQKSSSAFFASLQNADGLVLGANIDRLDCFQSGKTMRRQFIIDMYTAHILPPPRTNRPSTGWRAVFRRSFKKRRNIRTG
jgi:ribonuclease J